MCIFVFVCSTTSVDYLEGDLGQTEFTPAGCLSLSTVREPLLGMFYPLVGSCYILLFHLSSFLASFLRLCWK